MACGCQNQNNNAVVVNQITPQSVVVSSCSTTLEQLLSLKENLINKKTPENSSFINSRLGLIESMINIGNYCLWQISEINF